MFKLVEESAGAGELSRQGVPHRVTYRIKRFQGHLGEGGLPVPGLYRIEGRVAFEDNGAPGVVAGDCATLRLQDGRSMDVTLEPDGSFQTEGRHSRGCSCC